MTTQLNGTEFVSVPANSRRTANLSPSRTGIAVRRDARRNRRATRAI